MRWPWHLRSEAAERRAQEAEQLLAKARADHAHAQRVAAEARLIARRNGFKDAIVALFDEPRR